MVEQKKSNFRWIKNPIFIILVVMLSLTGAFFIYTGDYYHAKEESIELFQQNNNIVEGENYLALMPEEEADTGLIFYPGAKVEYIAYLPILEPLRKAGITCILVEMPFNMAIFDGNAADSIQSEFPEISNWYVGGHSMGGAMASSYAANNPEKIQGLILLGAYIYGDYPPENTLTIYGSYNTSVEKKINYQENVMVIEGGNHAQFGDYGKQKNDPDADISPQQQRKLAVEAIIDFIK